MGIVKGPLTHSRGVLTRECLGIVEGLLDVVEKHWGVPGVPPTRGALYTPGKSPSGKRYFGIQEWHLDGARGAYGWSKRYRGARRALGLSKGYLGIQEGNWMEQEGHMVGVRGTWKYKRGKWLE